MPITVTGSTAAETSSCVYGSGSTSFICPGNDGDLAIIFYYPQNQVATPAGWDGTEVVYFTKRLTALDPGSTVTLTASVGPGPPPLIPSVLVATFANAFLPFGYDTTSNGNFAETSGTLGLTLPNGPTFDGQMTRVFAWFTGYSGFTSGPGSITASGTPITSVSGSCDIGLLNYDIPAAGLSSAPTLTASFGGTVDWGAMGLVLSALSPPPGSWILG